MDLAEKMCYFIVLYNGVARSEPSMAMDLEVLRDNGVSAEETECKDHCQEWV